MRLAPDAYFIGLAVMVSARGTCDRARVGCVLTRNGHIITTGYNGAPRGLAHCDEVGHQMVDGHCLRTVHAETNALLQAARNGTTTNGATAYVTHAPCVPCANALVNAGIERVVIATAYRTSLGLDRLNEAGVRVDLHEPDLAALAALFAAG